MKIRLRRLLFFFVTLSIVASCSKKIQPVAPSEAYSKIEFPREISYINVPISYPVSELQNQINNQVKGLIFEDNSLEEDNIIVKVWKTEDIRLNAINDAIETTIPLKIYVKAGIGINTFGLNMAAGKDIEFELKIKYLTRISVNPNWTLNIKTTSNGHTWTKEPVLKLGPINIPVTGLVNRVLKSQLEVVAQNMDDQIKKNLNLKKYAQDTWNMFQTPIQISSQYNTWLKMTPKEVTYTPFQCKNDIFQTCIGFNTFIETSIGERPAVIPQKLPDIKTIASPANDFSLKLLAAVSHVNATSLIQKEFKGKTFSFKNDKYKIRLDDVELYGNNEYLVIKTLVSGNLNGTIYLKGIPYYDAEKNVIALKNFDFDLDSKNRLLRAANWLSHDTFVKKIQENFVIPIDAQLQQAKSEVKKYLTNYKVNNFISLNGELQDLVPDKISIQPDYIFVQIAAKGKLDVKLAAK